MRKRFEYIGRTPNGGRIFRKGKSELVIYNERVVKYWPDYTTKPDGMTWRDKNGMRKWN
jgi:hypothetical protein